MKQYEAVYILSPALTAEETDKFVEKSQQVVAAGGGEIEKVEKLGRKKLAAPVQRQSEGFYVQMQFRGNGPIVSELERTFRQSEGVLRHLTAAVTLPTKKALEREKRKGTREREREE